MLLNVPVNSYGHVEAVASDFLGLVPDTETNDTSSPAIQHHPSKQLWLICSDNITTMSDSLRSPRRLTTTQVLSRFAAFTEAPSCSPLISTSRDCRGAYGNVHTMSIHFDPCINIHFNMTF